MVAEIKIVRIPCANYLKFKGQYLQATSMIFFNSASNKANQFMSITKDQVFTVCNSTSIGIISLVINIDIFMR